MSGTAGETSADLSDQSLPAAPITYTDPDGKGSLTIPASNQAQNYFIFLDSTGKYYAATTANSPNDSLIAQPSADLYNSLVAIANTHVDPTVVTDAIDLAGNGEVSAFTADTV